MKKLFILGLFFLLTLTTGCSVTYNVEISNSLIKVNGELLETDSTKWNEVIIEENIEEGEHYEDPEFCGDGSCEDNDGASNSTKLTFKDIIDLRTGSTEYKINGLIKIDEKDRLGMRLKASYRLNTSSGFLNSPGVNSCYKNFSIVKNIENNGIIFSTSKANLCFEQYKNLEEIKIILKTNHKVITSNADTLEKNKYIWLINKENYKDKSIQIELSNDIIKKNNYLLIIGIIGCILLVGSIIYFIVNHKNKKVNRI